MPGLVDVEAQPIERKATATMLGQKPCLKPATQRSAGYRPDSGRTGFESIP